MIDYIKVNSEPLAIEYVEKEGSDDLVASFIWNGDRYYLDNFIRTHNNPWCSDNYPDHIHGYEMDSYFNPLFIELIGDEAVNVYREV